MKLLKYSNFGNKQLNTVVMQNIINCRFEHYLGIRMLCSAAKKRSNHYFEYNHLLD